MLKYIFRRILIFIPTLFIISLLAFVISVNAPGDPVEALFSGGEGGGSNAGGVNERVEREKSALRHRLGLDLPLFYFTIGSLATPDTFYKVHDQSESASLSRLINRYGNWPEISNWSRSVKELRLIALKAVLPDTSSATEAEVQTALVTKNTITEQINSLLITDDPVQIKSKLDQISAASEAKFWPSKFGYLLSETKACFEQMNNNTSVWKNYIPVVNFYGYNQYHRWIFGDGNWLTGKGAIDTEGVIRGDFGISYSTKQSVTRTIKRALPWSVLMTLLSVVFAYIISLPIGVYAASRKDSLFDRTSSVLLFMLYSLPPFFMGTLLLLLFANPEVFNLLPANGVKPVEGYPDDAGFFEKVSISLPYLILPLITYTYSSLAFLSRQMRVSMLEIVHQDFIRTARAKGLSERTVIWKHGVRNALLPIITVFSNIFPAAIGGSVLLEVIFGIPGMGREIFDAIRSQDYPMIVCVFTLSGFMTLVGYLVADILYAVADPRISYSSK
jgi:peptide/nickel transport system permease protein